MNEQQIQQPDWDARYQESHTPWDRGTSSPALLNWLDSGELAPCEILIPGCGRGHEVVELAKRGFDVTAIDLSTTAIEELKQTLDQAELQATLVASDFFQWQPNQKFAAIYEQTSLCALPPAQWPAYVQLLDHWLIDKGDLFALFMQTGKDGGPPWHCDLVTMQRLFKSPHWTWLSDQNQFVDHPSGLREMVAHIRK